MKDATPTLTERIPINPIHWDTPLQVELLPYLRFMRSINRQLRELVMRYSPARPTEIRNSRRFRSMY
jgi:hypothetical protein